MLLVGVVVLAIGRDASAAPCEQGMLVGQAALASDWRDDKPGLCRRILVSDLPQPSTSYTNVRTIVDPPPGALPQVPRGFSVRKLYEGDTPGRLLRAQHGGDLVLAESRAGRIRVLKLARTCTLASTSIFAANLSLPFGIAFYPRGPGAEYLYVAETSRIVRFRYRSGQSSAG